MSVPTPDVESLVNKYKEAREYRSLIEKKLQDLTARIKDIEMNAAPKEAEKKEEKKEDEQGSTEPFNGSSDALHTLFVIAFMLIRLSNQKNLGKPSAIKLHNYYKYFVKIIDIYEYMLILGHTMGYPDSKVKEDEKEEQPEQEQGKQEKQSGGDNLQEAEAKLIPSGPSTPIKEDPNFLRELKAFHAYLFMSVASNSTLKDILTNPVSESYKKDPKYLSALTQKEDKILASKEFLHIQDQLFENLVNAFMILFAKFEAIASIRSKSLQAKEGELAKLNENIAKFNSLEESIKDEDDKQENAEEQVRELEAIMKDGAVPIKDAKVLEDKATDLANDDELIKEDLVKQSTDTDETTLKKVYNSIKSLFKRKLVAAKPPLAKPPAAKPSVAKPSAPIPTAPKSINPEYPPVYPAQNPGYPNPEYPPVYPAQNPVYPAQNPGYPNPEYPPVYPAQNPGYPPVYPAQNPGYPPVYPAQNPGYPPVYPAQNPDYPPQNLPSDTPKPFNAPFGPPSDTPTPFNAPFPPPKQPMLVGGRLRRSRKINKAKVVKKTLRRSKRR
jgi:hypothetical protein